MSSEHIPIDRHARDRVEDAIRQAWVDRYGNYTIPFADFYGWWDLEYLLAIPEGVEVLMLSDTSVFWLPLPPVSLTELIADTNPIDEESLSNFLVQLDENGQEWGFLDITGTYGPLSDEVLDAIDRLIAKGWFIVYMP